MMQTRSRRPLSRPLVRHLGLPDQPQARPPVRQTSPAPPTRLAGRNLPEINPDWPIFGEPTTQSVRDNFAAIKNLYDIMMDVIDGLETSELVAPDGPLVSSQPGSLLGSITLGPNLSLTGSFPAQTLNVALPIPAGPLVSANGTTLGQISLGRNLTTTGAFPLQTLSVSGASATFGPTSPDAPSPGDLWVDSTVRQLKVWDGSTWHSTGGGEVWTGATPPEDPTDGALWWTGDELRIFDNGDWANAGGVVEPPADGNLYLRGAGEWLGHGIIYPGNIVLGDSTNPGTLALGDRVVFTANPGQGLRVWTNDGTSLAFSVPDVANSTILLNRDPVAAMEAVTKQYLDIQLSALVKLGTAPASPTEGTMWWNGTRLMVWSNNQWMPAGGSILTTASLTGDGVNTPLAVNPATNVQINAGLDNSRAITPAGLRLLLGYPNSDLLTDQKTVIGAINELLEIVDALTAQEVTVGIYDAAADLTEGFEGSGLGIGPLPPASDDNKGWRLIVTNAGLGSGNAPNVNMAVGDALISTGTAWQHIPTGGATASANAIAVAPIPGLVASNVQMALEELNDKTDAPVLVDGISVVGNGRTTPLAVHLIDCGVY
jgi:hypothetical protein